MITISILVGILLCLKNRCCLPDSIRASVVRKLKMAGLSLSNLVGNARSDRWIQLLCFVLFL